VPSNIKLSRGSHAIGKTDDCGDQERCLFEAYNWLTRERHTDDRPAGVSWLLYRLGMRINDMLPDDKRQALVRFLPNGDDRLAGTADDGQDKRRAWMVTDWLTHTWAPLWLDAAGMETEATVMRELGPITDPASADLALPVIQGVRKRAWERRREVIDNLNRDVRIRVAAAAAVAAAVAAAAADAAAAAAAVAAADAVADAAAAAAADAAADYWSVYDTAYKAGMAKYQEIASPFYDQLIDMYDSIINPERNAA
jgi:hypothetical protein